MPPLWISGQNQIAIESLEDQTAFAAGADDIIVGCNHFQGWIVEIWMVAAVYALRAHDQVGGSPLAQEMLPVELLQAWGVSGIRLNDWTGSIE